VYSISITLNSTYNRLGHLNCTLCNIQIKNELLWQTHILGKQHKEKVAGLKGAKESVPGPAVNTLSSQPLKRKTPDTENQEVKKVKGSSDHLQTCTSGLPTDYSDTAEQTGTKALPSKCLGPSLLPGDYDEEENEEAEIDNSSKTPLSTGVQKTEVSPLASEAVADALPSDFFDNKAANAPIVSHSGSIQKAEVQEKIVERKENTAEALPEGFFDDPEVDAKVRKVDAPKDQMDKEWEEFQKAMRQVNTVSEAIVAEEDEEGRLDRQIGEIDEQIECYRRVELLRNRQDMMKDKIKESMRLRAAWEEDDIGSGDEGELKDFLSQDWRVKGALL
uniref:Zinc finger protein 830 n=1 Tax=Sphenodon punctatus TaxID=8508 RepID=A0A8D0H7W6_SPHPU